MTIRDEKDPYGLLDEALWARDVAAGQRPPGDRLEEELLAPSSPIPDQLNGQSVTPEDRADYEAQLSQAGYRFDRQGRRLGSSDAAAIPPADAILDPWANSSVTLGEIDAHRQGGDFANTQADRAQRALAAAMAQQPRNQSRLSANDEMASAAQFGQPDPHAALAEQAMAGPSPGAAPAAPSQPNALPGSPNQGVAAVAPGASPAQAVAAQNETPRATHEMLGVPASVSGADETSTQGPATSAPSTGSAALAARQAAGPGGTTGTAAPEAPMPHGGTALSEALQPATNTLVNRGPNMAPPVHGPATPQDTATAAAIVQNGGRVPGHEDDDPYDTRLQLAEQAQKQHLAAMQAADEGRLRDARLHDGLFQALGHFVVGVGGLMAGPRGLTDRASLERQVEGLGGEEQQVIGDLGRRDKNEQDRLAMEATAARGAQERADRERAFGLQERGIANTEATAAQRIREEAERTQGAYVMLRSRNPAEGQPGHLSDEELHQAALNSTTAAGVHQDERTGPQNAQDFSRDQQARQQAASHALAEYAAAHRHGHGGSGAPRNPAVEAQLVAAAVATGMSEEDARAHLLVGGRRGLNTAMNASETRAGSAAAAAVREHARDARRTAGSEIVQGVTSSEVLSAPAIEKLREAISHGVSGYRAVSRVEELARAGNLADRLDPATAQTAAPRIMELRSVAAQIQGTGIINPSEVPVINAALPDPTSLRQMTFGQFQSSIHEWKSVLDDHLRAGLIGHGVDDEGVTEALRLIHGGATRPRPAAAGAGQSDRIRVRLPNGTILSGTRGTALPPGAVEIP